MSSSDHQHGHHGHGHSHDHDHAPISDGDGPVSRHEVLEIALRELLIEKGLISAEQVQRQIETMESRNPALGAKIVARAWADRVGEEELLAVDLVGRDRGLPSSEITQSTNCWPRSAFTSGASPGSPG
jgi:hypothetical protein